MMNQNQWLVSCTPPASTVLSTPMKSSKSYGDLLSEMKKEQAAQNFYFPPNPRQSARKLSSQTPPPPSKQELTSHNKIDEWMTWPDLVRILWLPNIFSYRKIMRILLIIIGRTWNQSNKVFFSH